MQLPDGLFGPQYMHCCKCGCPVLLPLHLHQAANDGGPAVSWYCGYGHKQHFKVTQKEWEESQPPPLPKAANATNATAEGENIIRFPCPKT